MCTNMLNGKYPLWRRRTTLTRMCHSSVTQKPLWRQRRLTRVCHSVTHLGRQRHLQMVWSRCRQSRQKIDLSGSGRSKDGRSSGGSGVNGRVKVLLATRGRASEAAVPGNTEQVESYNFIKKDSEMALITDHNVTMSELPEQTHIIGVKHPGPKDT